MSRTARHVTLNLPGPNRILPREEYLHVTNFPIHAKTNDFFNAFNPSCSLIRVHWLDDKNVFLQFNNVDGATMALDPKSFAPPPALKNDISHPDDDLDAILGQSFTPSSSSSTMSHCLDMYSLSIQTYNDYERSLFPQESKGKRSRNTMEQEEIVLERKNNDHQKITRNMNDDEEEEEEEIDNVHRSKRPRLNKKLHDESSDDESNSNCVIS
jgi:hypothetical protein